MKSVRDEWNNERQWGRAVEAADPVASTAKDGSDMQDRNERVPVDAPVRCPQCDTRGWASAIRRDEYASICGSRWDVLGIVTTGPACLVIEHKNDVIAERDARVAELERVAEVAA